MKKPEAFFLTNSSIRYIFGQKRNRNGFSTIVYYCAFIKKIPVYQYQKPRHGVCYLIVPLSSRTFILPTY